MLESPRRVEKPWGYELIWAETDEYVGKILHVTAGEALSLQYHEIKDETLDMRIINIGADYDFMAMVSCQLLKKHKVETVKRVVVRDEAAPEKVLGGYDCSKTLEKKETK